MLLQSEGIWSSHGVFHPLEGIQSDLHPFPAFIKSEGPENASWHKFIQLFRGYYKSAGSKIACCPNGLHPQKHFSVSDGYSVHPNMLSCLSGGGFSQKCLSRVHPIQKFFLSDGGSDQKCLNGTHLNNQISALDGPVTDRPIYCQIS